MGVEASASWGRTHDRIRNWDIPQELLRWLLRVTVDKSLYRRDHAALAGLLREIRVAQGLKQADVAARLDEPQSFVSKYESGERRLDLLELRQVCAALWFSVSELVQMLEEQLRARD